LELLLITHLIRSYSLYEGYLYLLVFYRCITGTTKNYVSVKQQGTIIPFSAWTDIFQSWHSLGNIITVFPLQKPVMNKWLIFTWSNFGKVIFPHSSIIHYTCARFFLSYLVQKRLLDSVYPVITKITVWLRMLLVVSPLLGHLSIL